MGVVEGDTIHQEPHLVVSIDTVASGIRGLEETTRRDPLVPPSHQLRVNVLSSMYELLCEDNRPALRVVYRVCSVAARKSGQRSN